MSRVASLDLTPDDSKLRADPVARLAAELSRFVCEVLAALRPPADRR